MSQQHTEFEFDFSPFSDYVPYDGEGGSDRVPFDGLVKIKVVSATGYFSKKDQKPMAKIVCVIEDGDAKGLKLISNQHMGGKDKNNDDMGRQFIDVLISTGTDLEKIHANAKNGIKLTNTQIFETLKGREGYLEIEADMWEGNETTAVKNWIKKERYEQAAAIGAHRKPRRALNAAAVSAQASAVNLGGTNGAAAPTGTSQMPML